MSLTDWTDLPETHIESRIAETARALMTACLDAQAMMATAESCTGGLISAAMTEIPGSSEVFERGWATYSNAAKSEELGVDPSLIEKFGAVSAQVAAAMAEGAAARSGASLALSVTGVAGPGASEAKPVGLVYFGCRCQNQTTTLEQRFGERSRAVIRQLSVLTALDLGVSRLRAGAG